MGKWGLSKYLKGMGGRHGCVHSFFFRFFFVGGIDETNLLFFFRFVEDYIGNKEVLDIGYCDRFGACWV